MGISFLFEWRAAIVSIHGPGPTTRHVLLTLSLHMDVNGDSCFPATRRLKDETGLSERTICTHLEKAEKDGWIKKMIQGLSGQGWKRHCYTPIIPAKVLKEVQHLNQKGTEGGSARLNKGTEPNGKKALKEVQPSTSVSTSNPFFSFLKRYNNKNLIDEVFKAIATTRKTGKVAESVLIVQLQKWERYPAEQVEAGIRIYLEKDYASQGKREAYLMGIIRNHTAKTEQNQLPPQREVTPDNISELYEN
jgi:hypothetical protein